uniref:Uncharacterized protein n=2 Tax=viral metagenome TaxID=1070528 RepID=A0A6H1ZGZ0_9ZZZZ
MKITNKWLIKRKACEGAIEWFNEVIGKPIEHEKLSRILLGEKKYAWANWLVVHVMRNKNQRVRYAIYAASLVLKYYEDCYPDDDRPRKAIQAAKKYLKNKNIWSARSAAASAESAWSAASAESAASAAWSAASAAWSAAARSAAASVAASVASAAWSAAARSAECYAETLTKIINYGLRIIKE